MSWVIYLISGYQYPTTAVVTRPFERGPTFDVGEMEKDAHEAMNTDVEEGEVREVPRAYNFGSCCAVMVAPVGKPMHLGKLAESDAVVPKGCHYFESLDEFLVWMQNK